MSVRVGRRALMLVAAAGLAGCDNGVSSTATSDRGPIRAEAACEQPGLAQPLRQTLILVDERAIAKAADGIEFAKVDTAFRDLVLSIADPAKAIASGASAPRERITIALAPADGSPAETTFTGCLPGMTPDELAAAQRNQSAISSAFSASPAGQLEKEAEAFEQQLIGGMVAAAAKAGAAPHPETAAFADSKFFAAVRGSKALFDTPGRVGRIILVSDLSNLSGAPDADDKAFAAGAEAGRRTGGDLARAELHIVEPAGRSLAGRAWLQGFFLAQGADLQSLSAGRFASTGAPPAKLWRYTGQAIYPSSGPQLVDIRIGQDAQGRLTGSWLTLMMDPHYPIPMTGQMVCASDDQCHLTSDNGGFAQAWSGVPAGKPRFDRDLPFGGARSFGFDTAGERLTGHVYDEALDLGDTKGIPVSAQLKH